MRSCLLDRLPQRTCISMFDSSAQKAVSASCVAATESFLAAFVRAIHLVCVPVYIAGGSDYSGNTEVRRLVLLER